MICKNVVVNKLQSGMFLRSEMRSNIRDCCTVLFDFVLME